MSDDETTIEVKGLDQILKALQSRLPQARVGILGSHDARSGKGTSNATIGAAHEFGTSVLPQRSFLRMPLTSRLQKEMETSQAFDKDVLNNVIKSGSVLPWLTKVAILAHKTVLEAFASNGFGTWKAWSASYSNNTGNILVDSTQLRDSVTYEVKE